MELKSVIYYTFATDWSFEPLAVADILSYYARSSSKVQKDSGEKWLFGHLPNTLQSTFLATVAAKPHKAKLWSKTLKSLLTFSGGIPRTISALQLFSEGCFEWWTSTGTASPFVLWFKDPVDHLLRTWPTHCSQQRKMICGASLEQIQALGLCFVSHLV